MYVQEILAPSLTADQIVIMDNLAAHKGKKVEQLIEARGCQLLFLPGYSPDFSPIEETFSKLKVYLRRAGARTREALQAAICQALLTITPQDVQGWFRHCGYLPAEGRALWLALFEYCCSAAFLKCGEKTGLVLEPSYAVFLHVFVDSGFNECSSSGSLLTQEFFALQSNQPLCSQLQRTLAVTAFSIKARRWRFLCQQTTGK